MTMLENGEYAAWFRTALGEGTGVVTLKDGAITGSDTILAYSGSYNQAGESFTVDVTTRRHSLGHLSVFGIDNVDLKLEGRCAGRVASCHGKTKQAPGLAFEATLIRITD